MRIRCVLTALLVVSLLAGCAATDDGAAAWDSAPRKPASVATGDMDENPPTDKERMVCTDDTPTGTHLPSPRRCATVKEWERRRQQDQDAIRRAGQVGRQTQPPGN